MQLIKFASLNIDLEKCEYEKTARFLSKQLKEQVRPILFLQWYFISENAKIYRISKLRGLQLIAPLYGKRRCPTLAFKDFSVCRPVRIDRIVAYTFLENPPELKQEVIHIDGEIQNCASRNLKWGDKQDFYRSMREKRSKLDETRVRNIVKLLSDSIPVYRIARIFKVRESTINAIQKGKIWVEVPRPKIMFKVSNTQKILELSKQGKNSKEIQKELGLKIEFIYQMRSRLRRRRLLEATSHGG